MDELIKQLQLGESVTPVITIWLLIIGLSLSAGLSMFIGLVYRRVHGEAAYSQVFVHTLVLLSVIVCLIMLVIGSNIARAFSLVGALSIIRFRTAIRSPLDVAFLFFTMAVGMACGTRFFAVATVGTLIISLIMLIMNKLNYGSCPERREFLLSVQFNRDVDYNTALDGVLGSLFKEYSLTYTETARQGALINVIYSVVPNVGITDQKILEEVSKLNDNLKVTYRMVRHAIEIP